MHGSSRGNLKFALKMNPTRILWHHVEMSEIRKEREREKDIFSHQNPLSFEIPLLSLSVRSIHHLTNEHLRLLYKTNFNVNAISETQTNLLFAITFEIGHFTL